MTVDYMKNIDCLIGMKDIPDKSIDMICADLPYGITHNKWDAAIPLAELWKGIDRIVKDTGAIILFASGMFTADLMQSNRKKMEIQSSVGKESANWFFKCKPNATQITRGYLCFL